MVEISQDAVESIAEKTFLSPREVEAVLYHHNLDLEDCSYGEEHERIADKMDVSPNTVETYLQRAYNEKKQKWNRTGKVINPDVDTLEQVDE